MRLVLLALVAAGCATAPPAAHDAPSADTTASGPPRMGPVFAGPMRADPVYDAATLVAAMHDRYADAWPETVAFRHTTHRQRDDGTVETEVWRERIALPGRLRVEMGDPLVGPDVLYARDSVFVFHDGALVASEPGRSRPLLWAYDVYAQPPAATLRALRAEGVDLDAFRTDVWDGALVYVLGTPETGEAWVDRERLTVVRHVRQRAGGTEDLRFLEHTPLGGGWLARRVETWDGDARVFWAETTDVEADVDLDPVLFDPRRWAEAAGE